MLILAICVLKQKRKKAKICYVIWVAPLKSFLWMLLYERPNDLSCFFSIPLRFELTSNNCWMWVPSECICVGSFFVVYSILESPLAEARAQKKLLTYIFYLLLFPFDNIWWRWWFCFCLKTNKPIDVYEISLNKQSERVSEMERESEKTTLSWSAR